MAHYSLTKRSLAYTPRGTPDTAPRTCHGIQPPIHRHAPTPIARDPPTPSLSSSFYTHTVILLSSHFHLTHFHLAFLSPAHLLTSHTLTFLLCSPSQAERGLGFREELEPRMNTQQLLRLCQDLDLVSSSSNPILSSGGAPIAAQGAVPGSGLGPDGSVGGFPLTYSSVDVVFAKSKAPGGPRRLSFPQWLRAMAALSDEAGRDLFAIMQAHVAHIQQFAAPGALEALVGNSGMGGGAMIGGTGSPPTAARAPNGGRAGSSGLAGPLPKLAPNKGGGGGSPGHAQPPVVQNMQVLSPPVPAPIPEDGLPPGRLTLLEKALQEEEVRAQVAEEEAAAMAAARAAGRTPMAHRTSGGGSSPAGAATAARLSAGVPPALPRAAKRGQQASPQHTSTVYAGDMGSGAGSPGQPIHAWGESPGGAADGQWEGGASPGVVGSRPGSRQVAGLQVNGLAGDGEGGTERGQSPGSRRGRSAGLGSPPRSASPGRAAIKVHQVSYMVLVVFLLVTSGFAVVLGSPYPRLVLLFVGSNCQLG